MRGLVSSCKSLVARVQAEARTAVLSHLEGLNHTYLHRSADLETARAIVLNAKMRRVSVCGATETLLVDRAAAQHLLPPIAADLIAAGCEVIVPAQTCCGQPMTNTGCHQEAAATEALMVKAVGPRSNNAIAALRTVWMLYVVLRAYSMKHFSNRQ